MAATFQRHAERFFSALDHKIEPPVKDHLKRVYTTMGLCTLTAGVASYLHLYSNMLKGGMLSSFAAFGLAILLTATPDNGKNRDKRMLYLLGFAAMSGLSLGPLFDIAMFLNPTIIPVALISTACVFASFSLSAIFSDHRKWLYMGGTLMSLLSVMMMMSLVNLFLGSFFVYQAQLYLGLGIFSLFIIYDTADIIEKRRYGDDDYIRHAMHLFIDFIDLLRTVVILLMQKESNNQRNKSRNKK